MRQNNALQRTAHGRGEIGRGARPPKARFGRRLVESQKLVRIAVRNLALALPVAFVLHVLEEAPLFVPWFNTHVTPQITQGSFLTVNAIGLVITVAVAFSLAADPQPVLGLLSVAWVSFLMLANGLFHSVATVALDRYCPGVITGSLVYLPLSIVFMWNVAQQLRLSGGMVVIAAFAGATPMVVHGYLIVVRGSRLF